VVGISVGMPRCARMALATAGSSMAAITRVGKRSQDRRPRTVKANASWAPKPGSKHPCRVEPEPQTDLGAPVCRAHRCDFHRSNTAPPPQRYLRHVTELEPAKHSALPKRRPSRRRSRGWLRRFVNTLDIASNARWIGDHRQELHAPVALATPQNIKRECPFQ
jgi:hypothetical protein